LKEGRTKTLSVIEGCPAYLGTASKQITVRGNEEERVSIHHAGRIFNSF